MLGILAVGTEDGEEPTPVGAAPTAPQPIFSSVRRRDRLPRAVLCDEKTAIHWSASRTRFQHRRCIEDLVRQRVADQPRTPMAPGVPRSQDDTGRTSAATASWPPRCQATRRPMRHPRSERMAQLAKDLQPPFPHPLSTGPTQWLNPARPIAGSADPTWRHGGTKALAGGVETTLPPGMSNRPMPRELRPEPEGRSSRVVDRRASLQASGRSRQVQPATYRRSLERRLRRLGPRRESRST